MPERIVALHGGILVLEDLQPEKSKGGVWYPERVRNRPRSGVVTSRGEGVSEDLSVVEETGPRRQIEVGDRVLYSNFDGVELYQGDEKFLYMQERDVLAVIGKGDRIGQE